VPHDIVPIESYLLFVGIFYGGVALSVPYADLGGMILGVYMNVNYGKYTYTLFQMRRKTLVLKNLFLKNLLTMIHFK
jgi:hypothetical protein